MATVFGAEYRNSELGAVVRLVLDWELGSYSFGSDRLEVAWESGR